MADIRKAAKQDYPQADYAAESRDFFPKPKVHYMRGHTAVVGQWLIVGHGDIANKVYQFGRAAPLYYGRRADAWTPGGQWDINKPPSPLFVYAVPIMSSPDP
ncbi:MAG: hypothetical protein HRF49_12015, partial [bacterium]